MKFEWDERKNRANIRKHGFDLADGWKVFQNPLLVRLDTRQDYGEDRWQGIGMLAGRVVVVVFAEKGPDIRIISMRKAKKHECEAYEKAIKD